MVMKARAKGMPGVLPPSWGMSATEIKLHNLNQMKEKEFQAMVIQGARSLGFTLIYHTFDSRRSEPGFPDLVLVNPQTGVTLYRELKTKTGRVSQAQKKWLDGLSAAGNDASVWRPADWASGRIIAELKGEAVSENVS